MSRGPARYDRAILALAAAVAARAVTQGWTYWGSRPLLPRGA